MSIKRSPGFDTIVLSMKKSKKDEPNMDKKYQDQSANFALISSDNVKFMVNKDHLMVAR